MSRQHKGFLAIQQLLGRYSNANSPTAASEPSKGESREWEEELTRNGGNGEVKVEEDVHADTSKLFKSRSHSQRESHDLERSSQMDEEDFTVHDDDDGGDEGEDEDESEEQQYNHNHRGEEVSYEDDEVAFFVHDESLPNLNAFDSSRSPSNHIHSQLHGTDRHSHDKEDTHDGGDDIHVTERAPGGVAVEFVAEVEEKERKHMDERKRKAFQAMEVRRRIAELRRQQRDEEKRSEAFSAYVPPRHPSDRRGSERKPSRIPVRSSPSRQEASKDTYQQQRRPSSQARAVRRPRPASSPTHRDASPVNYSVASVPSSGRSNRKLIENALKFVCLAGTANELTCMDALHELHSCPTDHFIVLLHRSRSLKFKALYCVNFESTPIVAFRIFGDGPRTLGSHNITHYFKYDSAAKNFRSLSTTDLTKTTDAVSCTKKGVSRKTPR